MAEQKRDYYEVLGVEKNADDAAIKKAYRVLAKKYHPDMNPGDAEAEKKFKEASEAYAILSDPEKRRQYDQFGHAAFDGEPAVALAALILTVQTLAIFSVISLAILWRRFTQKRQSQQCTHERCKFTYQCPYNL